MTATPDLTAAEELRAAGLRVTAVRVALLEAVRHGDHLGVEALAAGVRERVGHVSLQAVYEALNALAATGLVRRIEPAGGPARFEGRDRGQPPPRHLPGVRCGRRRRLRGRRGAVPDRVRRPRLRDRRGRGHLLGPVPRLFHCPQLVGAVTTTSPEGIRMSDEP